MKMLLKILAVIFLLIILGVAGGAYYFSTLLRPVDPNNKTQTTFVVPKGQSISVISHRLEQEHLIRSWLAFRFAVMEEHLNDQIQAGTFFLSPDMTPTQIAQTLTVGTQDVKIIIPEGWRVEEVADRLAELHAQGQLPEFDKQEFLNETKNDEGYLFPDTYVIPQDFSASQIRDLLRNTFDKKVKLGLQADIAQSGKNLEDIMILASLVQREARQPETMKMVAGILWNRVDLGMALNVDATLQYIKGYDKVERSWWVEPLAEDKKSTSPFNTYKYPGFPPHPIDSPGMSAILAALHPTPSDYLFYITDPQGVMHYSKTLEEHNAFVQKYLR